MMADVKPNEAEPNAEPTLFPKEPGERLREAREAQGLTLAEIAARTRVPVRHLEAIERSDFGALPSPTYAMGFAKAYARAVGVDEIAIGREIRQSREVVRPAAAQYQPYDTVDAVRTPPRGLALGLGLVAVALLVVVVLFYSTDLFFGAPGQILSEPPAAAPAPTAAPLPPPTAAPTLSGPVVLTATDTVWLRVYEGDKRLYEAEMAPGDHYQLPDDAVHPMINIGRPDKLTITVGGRVVPPLGTGDHAIKDVEISAAALNARAQAPAPGATPSPTPTASPASPASAPRDRHTRRAADARPRRDTSEAEATRRANLDAAPAPTPAAPNP